MTDAPTSELKIGIFETEIKNRFLCSVCVNGETVTCYIPSSCRLSNFIDMKEEIEKNKALVASFKEKARLG